MIIDLMTKHQLYRIFGIESPKKSILYQATFRNPGLAEIPLSRIIAPLSRYGKDRVRPMGQRRERKDRRLENQMETRKKNAPRKAKERIRKAARVAAKSGQSK
jgi:hypothetical protein